MWGENQFGQLGDDSTANKNYPVEIAGNDERWMWLDVGYAHAGAVKNDGSAWIWGLNDAGQLGSQNRINQSSPIQALLAGKTWMSLYCGRRFSGAIELPASPTPQYTPYATQTPASTLAPTSTPISTNPTPSPTLSLSPTPGATEPTATPSPSPSISPTPTGTEATVTPTVTASPTPSGTIAPTATPLPTGTEATVTPTPSVTLSPTPSEPTPTPTTGILYTWGTNNKGVLGLNQSESYTQLYPVPINTAADWMEVASAFTDASAIKINGQSFVWGDNSKGQLGNSSIVNSSLPIVLGSDKMWKIIGMGGMSYFAGIQAPPTPSPT